MMTIDMHVWPLQWHMWAMDSAICSGENEWGSPVVSYVWAGRGWGIQEGFVKEAGCGLHQPWFPCLLGLCVPFWIIGGLLLLSSPGVLRSLQETLSLFWSRMPSPELPISSFFSRAAWLSHQEFTSEFKFLILFSASSHSFKSPNRLPSLGSLENLQVKFERKSDEDCFHLYLPPL